MVSPFHYLTLPHFVYHQQRFLHSLISDHPNKKSI
nr:MAG TPA: hypothetical protein [Caudoviricetes sp.]